MLGRELGFPAWEKVRPGAWAGALSRPPRGFPQRAGRPPPGRGGAERGREEATD